MPVRPPLPPMPESMFGPLVGGSSPDWRVDAHIEHADLGPLTLRIQTSSSQTDDTVSGSWHIQLASGGTVIAATQVPWCPPAEARAQALAWARDAMLSALAATTPEPVAAIADAEG